MTAEPTKDRLARDLEAAGLADMAAKAREGHYDDYQSELPAPIGQLVVDLRHAGHEEMANRAADGAYDGTRAEAEAWARSPEGVEAFRELGLGSSRER